MWGSEAVLPSREAAIWDRSRKVRFILNDPLRHPFYWWPRTLLGYPIEFSEPITLDRLVLTNVATHEKIPIQFTGVQQDHEGVKNATLHFFSDLPSGGRREFVLSAVDAPIPMPAQVSETQESDSIVLDSGAVRVRIPASQMVNGDAPGPVMQFSRGGRWIGASTLCFEGEKVVRISTRCVEKGPLLIACEITYEGSGGSRYIARLQVNAGQEFVEFKENMEGMRPGVRGSFTSTWIGLDATHRQAPNHPFPLPDEPRNYDDYAWERIDAPWFNLDARCGSSEPIYPERMPAGELPIILGIYQPAPGNFLVGNWANFWNQQSNDALGVFIDHAAQWQDHEYAYERESSTLEIRTHLNDGVLSWTWPLARGRRSTCIAFYDHARDKVAMRELEEKSRPVRQGGLSYQVPLSFTSHTLFLQNRYGTIDLNQVKDWVLDYPDEARRQKVIFTGGGFKEVADLEREVLASAYVCTLPVTGARQMCGHGPLPGRSIVNFSPVPSRRIMGSWIDGFNRLNAGMSTEQRARLTAMYLFIAYVLASDEFFPIVPMLGGHPNYLADVKAAPPAMSFLFPEHPMAAAWADLWQKCVELNTHYNTRPSVKTWDADGGRWTEDIGTYVWAFVRPSLRTGFLLRNYDGVERFVTPQLADMTEWLVGALSAPFNGESEAGFKNMLAANNGRGWGVVGPGEGPRRIYPPIGAHAEQRMAPRSLWYMGTCLQRYAPLAAEHAMWASRSTDQDAETAPGNEPPWDDIMYRAPDNLGTNPHLRSRKHTGYGVVLRAAVGTPDELSVHLQQIDDGPNYRWGLAGEGGCGLLYFFAAGKSYSFNGSEDVGDRRDQDTDFCTNFGIFKNGAFRSIGANVLSRPFYNLGAGQFAEIVPRTTPTRYAAEEYVSRSVLLAGNDYFLLHDAVSEQATIHRFSWFVRRGSELPKIQFVRGAAAQNHETQRTDHQTAETTGVWFDGVGDSMVVVSHRKDLKVESTPFGCAVQAVDVNDLVFRSSMPVNYADGAIVFEGTAGLIRRSGDKTEFALFHGTRIGVEGIEFRTKDTELGIGGTVVQGKATRGRYSAPAVTSVTIAMTATTDKTRFYIDGEAQTAQEAKGEWSVALPAGNHDWELTGALPVPLAPRIARTENFAGGARVVVEPVASANRYRLEVSKDHGATWTAISVQDQPVIEVNGLVNGQKVHVRAVAMNALHESLPGPEYPIYETNQSPLPPDGVHVDLAEGAATISWGEVLGVREYRLYVRRKGEKAFRPLNHGLERNFVDKRAGIKACDEIPGRSDGATPAEIFEYVIAAVNGNGEGARSRSADTDPRSWRNWDPRPGERFRRVYSYPNDMDPAPGEMARYYPE